jgi:serine/threonine protein kinase
VAVDAPTAGLRDGVTMLVVSDMYDAPHLTGYAVEGLLGVGGDARVWVAAEEHTGRRVALKMLRTRDSADRERLHREAALQAGIDHPHVLRVLAVHDTADALILVLELAEGGSLHDLITKRGALPPGEVVTACAPIAQALAAIHQHGLVHGDVSCANVLFTGDGRPLLADLGVARLAGEFPAEVGVTPGFSAPEVLRGESPGPAADVYSLAVAVRTALIGVMPDDPRAAIIDSPPLPAVAIRVIERAFSSAPRARPTAAELADALFRLSPPRPLNLPQPTPLPIVPAAPAERPTYRMRRESETEDGAPTPYVGRRARKTPSRPEGPPRDPTGATSHPPTNLTPTAPPVPPARPRQHRRTGSADHDAAPDTDARSSPTTAAATTPPAPTDDVPSTAEQTRRRNRTRAAAAAEPPRRRAAPPPRRRWPALDWFAQLTTAANRRRDLARLATYIVVPVLLAGVVLVGWQWANSDREDATTVGAARPQGDGKAAASELCGGPAPAPTAQPAVPNDWAVVVRDLNKVRSQAFSKGDPKLLCGVYVPTSETLKADLELMDLYERRGVRAEGFEFRVESVTLVSQEGGRVVLEITDELPPYPLVDEEGKERATQPGKPKLTWRAELLPAPDGASWRYA